jgi:hypothetical protein
MSDNLEWILRHGTTEVRTYSKHRHGPGTRIAVDPSSRPVTMMTTTTSSMSRGIPQQQQSRSLNASQSVPLLPPTTSSGSRSARRFNDRSESPLRRTGTSQGGVTTTSQQQQHQRPLTRAGYYDRLSVFPRPGTEHGHRSPSPLPMPFDTPLRRVLSSDDLVIDTPLLNNNTTTNNNNTNNDALLSTTTTIPMLPPPTSHGATARGVAASASAPVLSGVAPWRLPEKPLPHYRSHTNASGHRARGSVKMFATTTPLPGFRPNAGGAGSSNGGYSSNSSVSSFASSTPARARTAMTRTSSNLP